jgi:hypothetical protein
MPTPHRLVLLLLFAYYPVSRSLKSSSAVAFRCWTMRSPIRSAGSAHETGAVCVGEGKPLQFFALFGEFIALQPENMFAYLNRGNPYLQSGQLELGVADFSHVNAALKLLLN